MLDDYDYHKNKKTNKIYVSKAIETKNLQNDEIIKIRYASKVIDLEEDHSFVKIRSNNNTCDRKSTARINC